MLTLGDFCFFGGEPSETLVKQAAVFILVPKNQDWAQAIEKVSGMQFKRNRIFLIWRSCPNMLIPWIELIPFSCLIGGFMKPL